MLAVLPAGRLRFDIGRSAFIEGDCSGRLELPLAALSPSGLDRVNSVKTHFTALGSAFTRLGERNDVDRPQSHLPGPAVEHEPVDPRLRSTGAHLEIKPAAIVIHSLAVEASHLDGGEPV